MLVSSEKHKAKERAKANWYSLRLLALLPVVAYLVGILVLPLVRGHSVSWDSLRGDLLTWAICTVTAAVLSWFAWKTSRRSDLVANLVFAAAIVGAGTWWVWMNASDRDNAIDDVRDSVDRRISVIEAKAHDIID